ncbi:hypothetical protein A9Q93_11745 [Nonlabens dokdonensis]|uniref:YfhO family protein n=1 Tax=Nonlabens dokdonensis TaxID=328515 RepID=A0A1Z8ALH7_9FLAO|nr:YfhO family protein [Nonlabens dokdonensis]OUS11204.1 hypothetical protein A9Q93_11745 [Nonlabens dokdonensis]
MKLNFKKIVPHLIVFVVFIVAALAYFHPVLSGKKLYQSDIVQYKGNARQLIDHRETTGEELYWTDAVFGGMPTYQLGARYDYDIIDGLDRALRFLPRPADYLFLYFASFYVLMLVMRVDWKIGLLGALAFGFSTYLIIIIGAGHNSKAHAIAYFPLVISGIILVFQKRYLAGFVLTALAMALELQANHPQMTYYLLITVAVLGVAYLIDAAKKNMLPHYFKSIGIMIAAVVLALGTNAANLLATSEYSKESTRGVPNITINAQGESVQKTNGLDYDYITEYSYGLSESMNLILPRFAGGGSGETFDDDSASRTQLSKINPANLSEEELDYLNQLVSLSQRKYWGDQAIVEAPAYLGVSVVFLALLSLFLIRGRLKWWTLTAIVLALLLSYGKNLSWLTELFIDYMPFYSKFRAVTSIQVIIELCVPILAAIGLWQFFNEKNSIEIKRKSLLYAGAGFGGLLLIIAFLGSYIFNLTGPFDEYLLDFPQLGARYVKALEADRFAMIQEDALIALLYVGLICGALYLLLSDKIKEVAVLAVCGGVILFDLISFDLKYVNSDDYVTAREYEFAFEKTEADQTVLEDQEHYRVYDQLADPNKSGRAAYFHKAMGGYHGAKPRRFQDLMNFYFMNPEGNQNTQMEILSMFNTRYFLIPYQGQAVAQQNPGAYGNAWFVDNIEVVENQNEEILAIKDLNAQKTAIITNDQKELLNVSVVEIERDSTAFIELTDYKTEQLTYKSSNSKDGLAVFSEMYYPHGWKASIDGEQVPIAKVNYALRGLFVPAGTHEIVFTFEPEIVQTGSTIMLISNILLFLIVLGGIILAFKKKKTT